MATASVTARDKRARLSSLPFATAAKEFARKIFRTCSIRSLLRKLTGPDWVYRLCTELFKSTEGKSKSKANCTRAPRFISYFHWCGSTARWLPHDPRSGLHFIHAGCRARSPNTSISAHDGASPPRKRSGPPRACPAPNRRVGTNNGFALEGVPRTHRSGPERAVRRFDCCLGCSSI